MNLVPRLVLLALVLAGTLSAADPWKQMKVGMSAAETAALLGQPLAHRQGHGFSTWTYDQGAEVLLHANGTVLGWTAPIAAKLAARSRDIWSNRSPGEYHGTMHSLLPRPYKTAAQPHPSGMTRTSGGVTYEDLIRG